MKKAGNEIKIYNINNQTRNICDKKNFLRTFKMSSANSKDFNRKPHSNFHHEEMLARLREKCAKIESPQMCGSSNDGESEMKTIAMHPYPHLLQNLDYNEELPWKMFLSTVCRRQL